MFGSRLWPNQTLKPRFEYSPRLNGTNRLTDGLLAWWLMNEGAGPVNSVVEKSGALYKATTSGTPVPIWVRGQLGPSIQIATSSVTTAPSFISNLPPHLGLPVTIGVVVFPTLVDSSQKRIFSYTTGATNDGYGIGTSLTTTNWEFSLGGVANYAFTTLTLTVNNWYTYVVTASAAGGTATAYLYNWNSETYQTQALTIGTPGGTTYTRITLGDAPGLTSRNWVGSINQAAIWNRVLSAAEVRDFMFFPYGTSISPLLIVSPRRTYSIPQLGVESWGPNISQPAPPKYVILSF